MPTPMLMPVVMGTRPAVLEPAAEAAPMPPPEPAGQARPGIAIPPLLAILQFGDSFFPAGGTSFSWGLESLHHDRLLADGAQVEELMQALVARRWAGFDRPFLRAAHGASAGLRAGAACAGQPGELAALVALDLQCEAMTAAEGARHSSRRLGATQLRVHAELGLPAAQAYLDAVRDGRAPGHVAIVQGLVWPACGIALADCEAMSAFGLCVAVVGAALRLGLLGHIEGQRLLSRMRGFIAQVLQQACPPVDEAWSGAPALDIALMRHEGRAARLFTN